LLKTTLKFPIFNIWFDENGQIDDKRNKQCWILNNLHKWVVCFGPMKTVRNEVTTLAGWYPLILIWHRSIDYRCTGLTVFKHECGVESVSKLTWRSFGHKLDIRIVCNLKGKLLNTVFNTDYLLSYNALHNSKIMNRLS